MLGLSTTLAAPAGPAPGAAGLTLERIFSDPPLQGRVPRQARISPGGRWVGFLRPSTKDSEQLELWAQPSAGGAPVKLATSDDLLGGRAQQLSEAEKMALERKRINERGITSYEWCGEDDRSLIVPLSGDLYLVRLASPGGDVGAGAAPQVRRLTFDADVPERDPRCSPDGKQVAFVRNGNLWVQPLEGGEPRALTDDATPTRYFGLAEFIAGEEFDRQRGFWWSPDGQRLLVLRVDESLVPLKSRAQIFADHTDFTQQRYPAAGDPNARVDALVVDAATGARTALPLPADAEYVARAGWFDDGAPWLQVLTRDQTRLTLLEFDPRSGTPRVLTEERDAAWVATHDDLAEVKGLQLSGKPALLWPSESSGRRQLMLLDRSTGARRVLTTQPEAVARVVCTDGERVVFEGVTQRGRARELFVTDLAGKARPMAGSASLQWRTAQGDKACTRLLVTRSTWGEPPRLSLRGLDDATPEVALAQAPADAPDPLLARVVPKPTPLEIVAADGRTALNAFWFAPIGVASHASQRVPVMVLAYGGPGASTVHWRWSGDTAFIAWLQRQGYGVFMVDGRGMQDRDRAFTRAHWHAFGQVEIDDLFSAVHQLALREPMVDPARVGFFGWSYGGYVAARSMLDPHTPFAAAVAVAPVTDWTLYDTAYTERYLGLPVLADGSASPFYRSASLLPRAGQLRKPLLIAHGTADDNVLFEHSLRLIQALEDEGRLFDLAIYPGKAHGIAGRKAHLHLYRTMTAFLARHLKPAAH